MTKYALEELLTPAQVAKKLGLTTKTVQRWCGKGKVKAEKYFGHWRITPDELQVQLDGQKRLTKARATPSPTQIIKRPKTMRKPMSVSRVEQVHARADQMVKIRKDYLRKRFPNPKPGEVYEFVLHSMPPLGLRNIDFYEEEEKNGMG